MGYQTTIQIDLPYVFYSVDSLAGSTPTAPLVRGSGAAAIISETTAPSFSFPGFVESRRGKSFALEVWFRPLITNGENLILGHAEGDGILYDGEIIFRLLFTTGTAEVRYRPDEVKTFHVVAQYTPENMALYVNGQNVGGYQFTEEEMLTPFAGFASPTVLTSGSVGSEHIIDAIALYTNNIRSSMPKRHYELGSSKSNIMENVSQFGGRTLELNRSNLHFLSEKRWEAESWQEGVHSGTSWIEGYLSATDETGGEWKDSFLIDNIVDSVFIEWVGQGNFTVEYSIDGTTWLPAENLTQVAAGDLTDGSVDIRITFTDNTSKVDWLFLGVVPDAEINGAGTAKVAEVPNGASEKLFYPLDNLDVVGSSPDVFVPADKSPDKETTRSVEFWVKPGMWDGTDKYLFDSRHYPLETLNTNLVTNPSGEATNGTVEVRQNYVTNPRAAVDLAGASAYTGPETVTRVTGQTLPPSVPGDTAYQVSWAAGATNPGVKVSAVLATGAARIGSLWVKRLSGTGSMAAAFAGVEDGASSTPALDTWTRLDVALISGDAATTTLGVRLDGTAPDAGSMLVVGLLAERHPVVGDYFDGSYSPDPDLTPQWAGTAHASEARLVGQSVPGFTSTGAAVAWQSADWASRGSYSIRHTSRYFGPGSAYIEWMRDGNPTFAPGKTFTALATSRLLEARPSGESPAIGFSASDFPAATKEDRALNAPGIYYHRIVFTIPEAATAYRLRLYNFAPQGEPDVWWDDLLLVEGEYTGPYFDGDTEDENYIYDWTGTPHASTSIQQQYDTSAPLSVSPVLKFDSVTQTVIAENGGTFYVNNVAGTDVQENIWNHIVYVAPADENIPYTIGGGKVGMINLYTNALDQPTIDKLYGTYFGKSALEIDDPVPLTITEDGFELYAYEWSIIGAGG